MLKFTVYGTPKPQGSMRAFRHKTTGKVVTTSDNQKLKPWRQEIAQMALMQRIQPIKGGVAIGLEFYFSRPKSAPKSRLYPTVKPDLDKLIRAVFDSLKGVVYADDAEIVELDYARKRYDAIERVEIQVRQLA